MKHIVAGTLTLVLALTLGVRTARAQCPRSGSHRGRPDGSRPAYRRRKQPGHRIYYTPDSMYRMPPWTVSRRRLRCF
jgi:hypothetical protein